MLAVVGYEGLGALLNGAFAERESNNTGSVAVILQSMFHLLKEKKGFIYS